MDTDCFLSVDIIIHLAGASISKLWTSSYKKLIFSSRVDSTRLLFSSLKQIGSRHKIKQIISASAVGIYPSDFEKKFSETSKVYPSTFMEEVVNSWENEVNSFDSINIKVAKMRIGLVLSNYGGVLGPLKIPTSFGLGAAFGDGKQGQSWIHMDDLLGIFLKAILDKWEGVFNTVAPNPVNQTKLMSALSYSLKKPYFLPPIPSFLIKIVAGEMSNLVLDSHWVSSCLLYTSDAADE